MVPVRAVVATSKLISGDGWMVWNGVWNLLLSNQTLEKATAPGLAVILKAETSLVKVLSVFSTARSRAPRPACGSMTTSESNFLLESKVVSKTVIFVPEKVAVAPLIKPVPSSVTNPTQPCILVDGLTAVMVGELSL